MWLTKKGMPQNSPMAMALLEPSSITNNCYIALTRPMWHSKMVYPTKIVKSAALKFCHFQTIVSVIANKSVVGSHHQQNCQNNLFFIYLLTLGRCVILSY